MSNHFRHIVEEGEVEPEVQEEQQAEKSELPRNFLTQFFTEGMLSKQAATDMLPFIIYMAFLGMIYIGNRHFAENNIRDIDKLNKEVKELSWDFKSIKSDLMLKSTQTEVGRMVDTLGLKEPVAPPIKIVITSNEY
ncbi:FtsL-like putative cell division protein [Daejeonella oryzae]|uniref:FtsL-like putative cell division protein n=1 Tax=Daejeonella oryzae TaxID=1122943 RepID=UPI00040CE7DE|nr:FtsL-like putative cell division protein [Daejeonella oryzae]